MISIQEALDIIKKNMPSPQAGLLPIEECCGKVLAEDVITPEPLPRFTNSAMDGFAVVWEDVKSVAIGDTVVLSIAGESRAGIPCSGFVERGTAVSISTGGAMPDGADTIIPIEDSEYDNVQVKVIKVTKKDAHVRRMGEEIEAGSKILEAGNTLNPASIGLLASVGLQKVNVFKPPDISIISTGTELKPLGTELEPWQIRDSNSIMLTSAVQGSGGSVTFCSNATDELDHLVEAISQAESKSRILLICGGVSVGPHDLVKQAAAESGFEQLFWRVRQKPGKPLLVATKGEKLLFGLPGNPVSALNCFAYYVYPLIQSLLGKEFSWKIVRLQLTNDVSNNNSRSNFNRVKFISRGSGEPLAEPIEKSGSHMLTSLAYANGFFILEPGESMSKGELVDVYLYPWE